MNELSLIDPLPPSSLTLWEDLNDAKAYAAASKSINTRIAYQADLETFRHWCAQRGVSNLPALPETVVGFLSASARQGLKASSIGRRVSAIGYVHRISGLVSPTADPRVKEIVRGIRRTIGVAHTKKAPCTADVIMQMLALCPDTLKGKRDQALLALGFAGAFRRSELVALYISDLVEVPDGLRVLIRRSKTDQEGRGQEIAIPRGYKVRPVERVQIWLEASGITEGPVFRRVLKGGKVGNEAIKTLAVADIIKGYAKKAGLDPAFYSGHSLRSGFITSAAETGASLLRMADQSRHASLDTLRGYVRRADMFKDHAGAAFL